MLRWLLLIMLALAGCASRGSEADLQYIKQARSIGAEWALVNEQAARGRLTHSYVASMHRSLRDQLRTSSMSLAQPESRYGEEIRALLQQPDEASPEELRTHVEILKAIEDSLESA